MTVTDLQTMFDLWRAGDEVASAAYFTPDGTYREAGKEPIVGRDVIEARWAKFFHGGFVWRMDVQRVFGDGESFAVEYVWAMRRGDGSWDEKPGCALVKTRGGKIAEWREYAG